MTEKAIVLTTGGKIEIRELEVKDGSLYASLRKVVGGDIERVKPMYLSGSLVMAVNEEGRLLDLPFNVFASLLYGTQFHGTPIVGDVAILDEDYRDEGLDFTGLSDLLADELYRHFTKTFKQFIT